MARLKNSSFLASRGLSFSSLSNDELDQIHLSTLEVMGTQGLFIESEKARTLLGDYGCTILSDKRVLLPHHVVEDCIRWAPPTVIVGGRHDEDQLVLEKKRVHTACFGEAIWMIDPRTKKRRTTIKQDLVDISRVVNQLSNVHVLDRPAHAHDVANQVSA